MSARTYTQAELGEAIVFVYNGALYAHAEGAITHEETTGAKSALVALMEKLELEYRFEPQAGRPQQAIMEEAMTNQGSVLPPRK